MTDEKIVELILKLKVWDKLLWIRFDREFIIERRIKSYKGKSYKWINPTIMIIDELANKKLD